MKISSVLLAVVVLILVISLICIWFYPSIQDFMASNIMWNGINKFCDEFEASNTDTLDNLPILPEKTTLVTIPYLEYSDEELSDIRRFVNEGGTLLLMDDYGYGNNVLAHLGLDIRFSNRPLLDPLFCHKNQWMPKITDFTSEVKDYDINSIVLNHATILTNTEETHVIAWSSTASFLDSDENESWNQGEVKGPFPVAAKLRSRKGTVIAISDPSIIISGMVNRGDNYRFIKYLTQHDVEREEILIDRSHLSKAPLDVSKIRLIDTREVLSNPYALIGITAVIFVVVSRYTLPKGVTVG